MEHLLLLLGVPEDRFGSGEVGATSDVLRAYEVLNDNGAIVFGAHVNSTHGVAMRNIRFGGQTKIAYTQDRNLHALEVTDLASSSARSTARFFNGYQGRVLRAGCTASRGRMPIASTRIRTGRPTSASVTGQPSSCLPERTFAALRAVLRSDQFDRVRAARAGGPAANAIHTAREAGKPAQLAFHETIPDRSQTDQSSPILRDVVAFANGRAAQSCWRRTRCDRKTVAGVADPERHCDRYLGGNQCTGRTAANIRNRSCAVRRQIDLVVIQVPPGTERPVRPLAPERS